MDLKSTRGDSQELMGLNTNALVFFSFNIIKSELVRLTEIVLTDNNTKTIVKQYKMLKTQYRIYYRGS